MLPALLVLGVLAGLVAVFVWAYVWTATWNPPNQETFDDRFPPISDAEFLALCTPGTRPGVALKVRRIVAEHLPVAYDRVHPSMRFVEDIGAV